ncbi:hypothetical protein GCM10022419_000120 [Nonomuraea rosea]|uniref:CBS domain-containing protein n=1 Tax=Nonomuraea rosea TaxID=638574 RepID=A0ABP6V092_9ACTN
MSVEKLTAEQVMTHILVTVTPDESPLMAWELMRRASIRHLPVVDRDLLGILTRDDLAADWSGGPQQQSLRQVRDLIGRRSTPRANPSDPLPKVVAAMLDADCDAIPVMAEGKALVGLITATDVLRAVAGRITGRIADREEPGEVHGGMFRLEPVLPSARRS